MKTTSKRPLSKAGIFIFSTTILFSSLAPQNSLACACGCGLFDVGTASMLPVKPGGLFTLEYDFMNQDKNWSNTSKSAAENNENKEIKNQFITAGVQYMFNSDWGIKAEVPYWDRHFTTTNEDDEVVSFKHGSIGDVRIKGIYSGFAENMSTGVTFGLKLPTGDYKYENFDRDIQIGTGSTNILLGAYHMGKITRDNSWSWFINGQLDRPVIARNGYRPGNEVNGGTGVYYNNWVFGNVKIAPVAQVIAAYRGRDSGENAEPLDSGSTRVFISPGVEFDIGKVSVYTDVAVPVYQDVNGNQLVASELFKVTVGYKF